MDPSCASVEAAMQLLSAHAAMWRRLRCRRFGGDAPGDRSFIGASSRAPPPPPSARRRPLARGDPAVRIELDTGAADVVVAGRVLARLPHPEVAERAAPDRRAVQRPRRDGHVSHNTLCACSVVTVAAPCSRSPLPRAFFTAPRAASTRRCSRFRAKAARSAAYLWLIAILLRAPCRQPLLHVGLDVEEPEVHLARVCRGHRARPLPSRWGRA